MGKTIKYEGITNLNKRQMEFVNHYLVSANATEAYQLAYPNASYNTAMTNGAKLLRLAQIQQIVDAKQKELANKCLVTKSEIITVLNNIMHDESAKKNDRIKAGEVILKACGYNAPTESNINLNMEQPLFGANE